MWDSLPAGALDTKPGTESEAPFNASDYANMAELVDAQARGACGRKVVGVRFPLFAPITSDAP